MTDQPATLKAALADRFRIERELGAGGMATVYLARDLKHDREVALKVLRPELGLVLGTDRFLAEIKITARLDHPHILTLIDSGASEGFLYYVLPLVRGESLRAKLDREKQLGLEEAIAITRQVASALDYAHRQGIIHRDIKPENILLQEGEAMLADFGIALAVREAGGHRLTETGLSLGTPSYMSPEQATGDRELDARSDVYALGAVLYEMLAGEPPVTGPSAQAMIAKLLTERPTPLRIVRDTVPEGIEAAVAKALAKSPADRHRGAGEFSAALAAGAVATAPRTARRRWHPREIGLGAAAALGVAALAVAAWKLLPGEAPLPALGRSEQFTSDPGLEIQPALSPDGRLVAYAAGNSARMRIFIRPVAGGRAIPLSDDSTAVQILPRWSPSGDSLLFLTRGGVSVAPALGGSSRPVVPGTPGPGVYTAAWSPDGREIAFARNDSVLVSPLSGGADRLLAVVHSIHSCNWAPDGKWIACVKDNAESVRPGPSFGNIAPSSIVLVPAAGGEVASLVAGGFSNQSPAWSADSRRIYFISNRNGPRDIYAASIGGDGRARGEPARLTTGLGAISISLAADGRRLTYALYTARSNIWALPIPRGAPTNADAAVPLTSGSQVIESVRASRDGRWLVYDSDLRGNADVYRLPVDGGEPERLTSDPADEFAPDLSHDGTAVTYHSWRTGSRDIEVKPLNGGAVERVTDTPAQESYPVWSTDGSALLYFNQVLPYSIFIVRRGAGGAWGAPERLAGPGLSADWSPDGREVAYVGTDSEFLEGPVMVIPATGGTPRRLFVPGPGAPGARMVVWSADGGSLYYKSHDDAGRASFWVVSSAGGLPRLLVRFTNPDRQSARKDFAVDGRRFYFPVEDRQSDIFVAELVRK